MFPNDTQTTQLTRPLVAAAAYGAPDNGDRCSASQPLFAAPIDHYSVSSTHHQEAHEFVVVQNLNCGPADLQLKKKKLAKSFFGIKKKFASDLMISRLGSFIIRKQMMRPTVGDTW